MIEALYVISGMALWAFISWVINIGRRLFYFRQAEKVSILMLSTAIQDLEYIKMLKWKTMVEQGVDENKIKTTKNIEEETMKRLKDMAIKNLIDVYPKQFRGVVKYHDWKTAINWLQEQTKRGGHVR